MYKPRFLVTQAEYDVASPEERNRYNYVVVDDELIPLPTNFNIPEHGDSSKMLSPNTTVEKEQIWPAIS